MNPHKELRTNRIVRFNTGRSVKIEPDGKRRWEVVETTERGTLRRRIRRLDWHAALKCGASLARLIARDEERGLAGLVEHYARPGGTVDAIVQARINLSPGRIREAIILATGGREAWGRHPRIHRLAALLAARRLRAARKRIGGAA